MSAAEPTNPPPPAEGAPAPPGPFVSFVVPVYNEERVLEASLGELATYLDGLCAGPGRAAGWELVLVDDGSTDRSIACIERWLAAHPEAHAGPGRAVHLHRLPHNRGKGAAVRHGMLAATGTYRFFLDADLSTPLAESPRFLGALETGHDVVLGNRRVPGAHITRHQPWLRQTLGRGFTLLVNFLLAPGVQDFTCGFKGFRARAAQEIFERSTLDGWAFDAELVVIAQVRSLRLAQVPVSWHHEDDTKVRLVSAVLGSLRDVGRITLRRLAGRYA